MNGNEILILIMVTSGGLLLNIDEALGEKSRMYNMLFGIAYFVVAVGISLVPNKMSFPYLLALMPWAILSIIRFISLIWFTSNASAEKTSP